MARRWAYIHERVRELGFADLATYLVIRRIIQQKFLEEMATECNVRVNTICAHLEYYGLRVEVNRHRPQSNRRGTELVCNECGTRKYYSPAQLLKLDPATYRCRGCYGAESRA